MMLALFRLTHAPVSAGFGASWQRVGLPRAGGVGDQDAWTLQALDWLRLVHTTLLAERTTSQTAAPSRSRRKDRGRG